MAEEANPPSQASGLSAQQEIGSLPAQSSSQSTSPDASVHPSTTPLVMPPQYSDQSDYGPGLYAVSTYPQLLGVTPGFPPGTLIPLTFKIPTRINSTGTGGEEQGQEGRQGGPQRVVVRRFQFAFQLDLALIIKLAAVVFLFSQEGSRQRFILLILFASFIYLYQTGALTPLIRWIRRGGVPPQLHHPDQPPARNVDGNQPRPDGNVEADDQNDQPPAAVANENPPEGGQQRQRQNQNHFWYVLKEIQMFVVGFITSLLPGFHHHNE